MLVLFAGSNPVLLLRTCLIPSAPSWVFTSGAENPTAQILDRLRHSGRLTGGTPVLTDTRDTRRSDIAETDAVFGGGGGRGVENLIFVNRHASVSSCWVFLPCFI